MKRAIRAVLESIYDPEFLDTSHFRPGRGCHSALIRIRKEWGYSNWFLEFGISKCFHTIDRHRLIPILKEEIDGGAGKNSLFFRLIHERGPPSMNGTRPLGLDPNPLYGEMAPSYSLIYSGGAPSPPHIPSDRDMALYSLSLYMGDSLYIYGGGPLFPLYGRWGASPPLPSNMVDGQPSISNYNYNYEYITGPYIYQLGLPLSIYGRLPLYIWAGGASTPLYIYGRGRVALYSPYMVDGGPLLPLSIYGRLPLDIWRGATLDSPLYIYGRGGWAALYSPSLYMGDSLCIYGGARMFNSRGAVGARPRQLDIDGAEGPSPRIEKMGLRPYIYNRGGDIAATRPPLENYRAFGWGPGRGRLSEGLRIVGSLDRYMAPLPPRPLYIAGLGGGRALSRYIWRGGGQLSVSAALSSLYRIVGSRPVGRGARFYGGPSTDRERGIGSRPSSVLLSALLGNIYLHKLDQEIERIQQKHEIPIVQITNISTVPDDHPDDQYALNLDREPHRYIGRREAPSSGEGFATLTPRPPRPIGPSIRRPYNYQVAAPQLSALYIEGGGRRPIFSMRGDGPSAPSISNWRGRAPTAPRLLKLRWSSGPHSIYRGRRPSIYIYGGPRSPLVAIYRYTGEQSYRYRDPTPPVRYRWGRRPSIISPHREDGPPAPSISNWGGGDSHSRPRPEGIRICYARYADDFLLGIVGTVELLRGIQKRITHFLQSGLNGSAGFTTIAARSTVEFPGTVIREGATLRSPSDSRAPVYRYRGPSAPRNRMGTAPFLQIDRGVGPNYWRELEKRRRAKHRIHITASHLRSAIHSKLEDLGRSIPIQQLCRRSEQLTRPLDPPLSLSRVGHRSTSGPLPPRPHPPTPSDYSPPISIWGGRAGVFSGAPTPTIYSHSHSRPPILSNSPRPQPNPPIYLKEWGGPHSISRGRRPSISIYGGPRPVYRYRGGRGDPSTPSTNHKCPQPKALKLSRGGRVAAMAPPQLSALYIEGGGRRPIFSMRGDGPSAPSISNWGRGWAPISITRAPYIYRSPYSRYMLLRWPIYPYRGPLGRSPSRSAVSGSELTAGVQVMAAHQESAGVQVMAAHQESSKTQIKAPVRKILQRLRDRGIISRRRAWPTHVACLTNVGDEDIVNRFAGVAISLLSHYRCRDNFYQVRTIVDYQIRWSAIFTPAHKHKSSARKIIPEYSRDLHIVNGGKTLAESPNSIELGKLGPLTSEDLDSLDTEHAYKTFYQVYIRYA
nr:maturase-related protein [Cephalotaxus harringtonia var. wilsoniana]